MEAKDGAFSLVHSLIERKIIGVQNNIYFWCAFFHRKRTPRPHNRWLHGKLSAVACSARMLIKYNYYLISFDGCVNTHAAQQHTTKPHFKPPNRNSIFLYQITSGNVLLLICWLLFFSISRGGASFFPPLSERERKELQKHTIRTRWKNQMKRVSQFIGNGCG